MVALQLANSTAVVAGPAAAALLDAFAQGNIAISFSVSGFLISYFAGIYAIFSQLGIITENTKIAGASSGGLMALAHCSGAAPKLPAIVAELSERCRRRANCQTTLDRGVRALFKKSIPPDAYKRCSGVAYVSITSDKFPTIGADNVLVSDFKSNEELVDAAAATSYIPLWSGRDLTTKFKGVDAYDGFFSDPQPCPPDVGYCIRVNSANPPWNNRNWDPLLKVMARAATLYTGRKPRLATMPSDGYRLPSRADSSRPNVTAFEEATAANVDIAPGIFSNTGMDSQSWMDLIVLPGDDGINRHLYRLGLQDGRAWADATGLSAAAAAKRAAAPDTDAAASQRRGTQTADALYDAAVAAGKAAAMTPEAGRG